MSKGYAKSNGKIWLFVNHGFDVTEVRNSEQQLSILIKNQTSNLIIWVTIVYAKCDTTQRIELWEELSQIVDGLDHPWIIRGNFNVVLNGDEKIDGLPVRYKGSPFTWWNGRAIKKVKTALASWSRETYGDIFKQLIISEEIAAIKEKNFEEFPSSENRDSSAIVHIIEGKWELPWSVVFEVGIIKRLRRDISASEIPSEGKKILNLENVGTPYIRRHIQE
ncbi:hypothetical protein KY289_029239 [Solanum tuberosum]|nr:hypothetical protein KY289_029239 [Solanum tuberosum]